MELNSARVLPSANITRHNPPAGKYFPAEVTCSLYAMLPDVLNNNGAGNQINHCGPYTAIREA